MKLRLNKLNLEEAEDLIKQGFSLRDVKGYLKIKNKRGQAALIAGILFILAFIVLILASPILFEFVSIGAAQTGGASRWVIKLFPFVILLVFLLVGYKLLFAGD